MHFQFHLFKAQNGNRKEEIQSQREIQKLKAKSKQKKV